MLITAICIFMQVDHGLIRGRRVNDFSGKMLPQGSLVKRLRLRYGPGHIDTYAYGRMRMNATELREGLVSIV